MDREHLQILIELHKSNYRQGPGGDVETKKALLMAGLDRSRRLKVADIGCGTGASTILLAKELDAEITAVDFLPEFLEELKSRAKKNGVLDKITTLNCSMDALPFADEEFDVIWSEGAIYNMGFEAGVSAWRRFLKPGGILVVSEITWLTAQRPSELQSYWSNIYPEINMASAKIEVIERHGLSLKAYFYLGKNCWLDNYYHQLKKNFAAMLERHPHSRVATDIVHAEQAEIDLYNKYCNYFSYGIYIAQKPLE